MKQYLKLPLVTLVPTAISNYANIQQGQKIKEMTVVSDVDTLGLHLIQK